MAKKKRRKWTRERVIEEAKANGKELVNLEWSPKNSQDKALLRCKKCGHEFMQRCDSINKRGCPECAKKLRTERITKTTDLHRMEIEMIAPGYQIVEKYKGSRNPILYECDLGHEFKARPTDIMSGSKCPICNAKEISDRMMGANNPNYNESLTSLERITGRKSYSETKWKRRTKSMTGYHCEITGDNTNTLESHHIYAFHAHDDIRYEPINAVVMTAEWHRTGEYSFHRMYGLRSDDPNEFIEWLDFLIERTQAGELELELRRLYLLKAKVKRKMYAIDRSIRAKV